MTDPRQRQTLMIADDDANIVFAFRKTFEPRGFRVVSVSNGMDVVRTVKAESPALLFLDVAMPKLDGLGALERLREEGLELPVIVITGFGTMQTAIRAVQLGAFEYVTKPLDVDKIRILTDRALELTALRREVTVLRARLGQGYREHEMIGNELVMQAVYKLIGAATTTPNSTNVLITGESGTGKELVAKAVHESGDHSRSPFVAINCTVLPENLLESELFGHEKGAFTNAYERKLGKFEVAADGTVFLDEIGDMPPTLQQKLLRVVERRTFQRVGGTETIPVRARFVAATNRNLERLIKRNEFREDLYFRLNVITIHLPPLRERRGDIPLLIHYFVAKYSQKFRRSIHAIDPAVSEALSQLPYPGNVRELENLIARAVIMEKGEHLGRESFPSELLCPSPSDELDVPITSENLAVARRAVMEAFERKFIIQRLKASHGNVTDAAEKAGIERQSFQRLMKKYAIFSGDFRD